MEILNKDKQKSLVPDKGHTSRNNGKYDPDLYPQLAYEVLSKKHLQSLTHLANALDCTTEAIVQWRKKYPDFNEQVLKGLASGEEKFREKLKEHTFKPQTNVNNGLIKLLAGNVYGIREESPTVVINNNANVNTSKALKERGIPEPKIGLEDIPNDVQEKQTDCGVCEICDPDNCPGD